MSLIEQADPRIVLQPALAWAILVAVIGGGFWAGSTITRLETMVAGLAHQSQAASAEMRALIAGQAKAIEAIEARVRARETIGARDDERLGYALQILDQINTRLGRMEEAK